MCGECPGTARLCGQCSETARQSEVHRRRWMSSVWIIPRFATGIKRNLQCCGSHTRPQRLRARVAWGVKLADPGVATEPRGLTETTSMLADIFTSAAVSARGAALDVCVSSSAFDRDVSHYRRKIHDRRLSTVGLDSRWSNTPSCHTNDNIRSRHGGLSERATDVGKSPPTQNGNVR